MKFTFFRGVPWPLFTALIILTGCSEPIQKPSPEPKLLPAVKPEPEPEPAPIEPEPEPVEAEAAADAEPDWKELFAGYKDEYLKEFRPRPIGGDFSLKLKKGQRKVSGSLVDVTPDQVVLRVEAGEVGYSREGLAPESRAMLYAEDYAHLKALGRVRSEEAEYKQEQARLAEIARQKELAARPRPAPGPHGYTKPVVNPNDGAVLQVKEYLQNKTRNPESIRYVQWGKLQKHEEGFKVTCVYKLTSDEFGDTTESKYFFMDSGGRVLRTAAFRGTQAE